MPILVIHGGAGEIEKRLDIPYITGLDEAADAGYAVLRRGGTAVQAVIEAVRLMEANPEAFNAGVGAALTEQGAAELDACVMDSGGSAGAVAAVTNSRNPVLLAERVRTETPHVLLVGAGAEALERDPVPNDALLTPRSLESLSRWRERHHAPAGSATVGAVALADDGTMAAATSTGGVVGQWHGRVGDCPIPGAGTYANRALAVSCTGKGEAFLRAVTARGLAAAVAAGVSLARAVRAALAEVEAFDGRGGLIAVTAAGELAIGYNTSEMAYAIRTPTIREAGVGRTGGVRVVGPA